MWILVNIGNKINKIAEYSCLSCNVAKLSNHTQNKMTLFNKRLVRLTAIRRNQFILIERLLFLYFRQFCKDKHKCNKQYRSADSTIWKYHRAKPFSFNITIVPINKKSDKRANNPCESIE